MKDRVVSLAIEDARKQAAQAPAPAPAPAKPAPAPVAVKEEPAAKPPEPPATVLPKVQVRNSRITELDLQLRQQQKEIAREAKNTKSSELDKALNDTAVAKALSIFGGESAEHRASIAKERVELMEAEGDLLEEIAHARTKEEKQELQKQLDELKALRRDLEKNMR